MLEVKKLLAMSKDLWDKVDEYRWKNRIPSESEAMRELIEAGLEAKKAQKPKRS